MILSAIEDKVSLKYITTSKCLLPPNSDLPHHTHLNQLLSLLIEVLVKIQHCDLNLPNYSQGVFSGIDFRSHEGFYWQVSALICSYCPVSPNSDTNTHTDIIQ